MKMGIIDMGTNTFHLIIVEVDDDNFKFLYREKRSVRLGKDGISKGFITDAAIARAVDTLKDFKKVLEEYAIADVQATATSAVRNAKNGPELVDKITDATGIKTTIISGEAEAQFIYFGVTQALTIGEKPSLIMDIGGGSIEFIIGTSEETLWKESFEIGGQRLQDQFHHHDPIASTEITAIENFLEDKLQRLFEMCQKYNPKTLIGSSGTFDTLSDIYSHASGINREEGATEYPLDIEGFQKIHNQLISKVRVERLAIPGMIEMRVEMIVVASVLLHFLINRLQLQALRVSAFALKEGVLLHHVRSKKEMIS